MENNGVLIVNVDSDGPVKTVVSTTPPSPPQNKNKNITKVNLDYNDNKTIISINGDGEGEIFWSTNGYDQQKQLNGNNGNIWIDDNTSRSGHDSDHCSSSINSSNIEERHLDHDADDDDDDENGGEAFDLSDSEFEEILDEPDDNNETTNLKLKDDDDNENYQSCDDSAITEDMKNTSNTDNDDDDNDKIFHDDSSKLGGQILSASTPTKTTTNKIENISTIIDDKSKINLVNENTTNGCSENEVKMSSSSPNINTVTGDCDSSHDTISDELSESVNVSLVNRSVDQTTETVHHQPSQESDDRDGQNVSGGGVSGRRQSIYNAHPVEGDDQEDDGVFVDIMEKANEIVGFLLYFLP